jgi:hypothetical protein
VAAVRAAAEPRARADSWPQDWDRLMTAARGAGRLTDDGAGLQVSVESAAGA